MKLSEERRRRLAIKALAGVSGEIRGWVVAAGGELARDDDAAALKSANVSWNGEIDPQTFPLASSVAPYALDAPEDDEGVAEFDLPAFSLVGLVVDGVEISDPGCVAKTFPGFFQALDQLR